MRADGAKRAAFLQVARMLNEGFGVEPLLFGSLGLEERLDRSLDADDVDVLVPERLLREAWPMLSRAMAALGYALYDDSEHAFERDGVSVAFASLESLGPFAGVDISRIPIVEEKGARYGLLTLPDYLRVYEASSKDGYRKNVKHKQDERKIVLIRKALDEAKGIRT
ncbi:MAG: phosphoribosylanthranilate isomerase [Clostridiales bacterium]|nr:phosphoribosylanthranilate isomerase [Clostridiales bacterium]